MKWQGRRGSSNVRTSSGGGKMIGGGIGGIIIAGIWGKPNDGFTDWSSSSRRWQ